MKLNKFNRSFNWFLSKLNQSQNEELKKEINNFPELYYQLFNKLRKNYKPYFKNHSIEELCGYKFSFMFTDDQFKKVKLSTKNTECTRLVFEVKYKNKLIFRVWVKY